MGKKSSEHSSVEQTSQNVSRSREPLTFVVSTDRSYAESVLAQCADLPAEFATYPSMNDVVGALSTVERPGVVFAILVEKDCSAVDPLALRSCKLEYPQINYVMLLEHCAQASLLRFQSMGAQNIITPPFSSLNLKTEIETALPNVTQFKRLPDLMRRGFARLDFSIPSDLQYVLGVNHVLSNLLKEFGFPQVDCRINIPLVCDEALTNAILHGNQSDPKKKVALQIYVSASRIKIRIKDQGGGFDLEDVDDPTEGDALMRSSGRGVYLMRTIMDSVEYKEGGRVVELEKANTASNNSVASRSQDDSSS